MNQFQFVTFVTENFVSAVIRMWSMLHANAPAKSCRGIFSRRLYPIAACAAANLAIGTRKGEQLT
jgi:hypothetical protein